MSKSKSTLFKVPIYLFVVATTLSFLGLLWFKKQSRSVSPQSPYTASFVITKGQTLDQIGQTLKDEQLISSVLAFKIQTGLSGLTRSLQAGRYRLSSSLSLKEIVSRLTKGTSDRWITLLEGWRREQIAQEITDKLIKNNPEYQFNPQKFITISQKHEGKLYPDTYAFSLDTSPQQALDRLLENFQKQTKPLKNSTTLSNQQALVLASLIEREAATDQERPVIGGILYKRLQNNWPLQVDATIQYLKASRNCPIITCNWWPTPLTKQDLKIKSPYNSYLNTGLPPHPISNSSLASVKAAYNPVQTPYWFYLHGKDGTIHYAKSVEQHNQNIRLFLSP